MNAVGTYNKPTQRRGKRVVYRSTDPDEPRRETMKAIRFLMTVIIGFAVIFLASRWTMQHLTLRAPKAAVLNGPGNPSR